MTSQQNFQYLVWPPFYSNNGLATSNGCSKNIWVVCNIGYNDIEAVFGWFKVTYLKHGNDCENDFC